MLCWSQRAWKALGRAGCEHTSQELALSLGLMLPGLLGPWVSFWSIRTSSKEKLSPST